jgi:hypothetical protein
MQAPFRNTLVTSAIFRARPRPTLLAAGDRSSPGINVKRINLLVFRQMSAFARHLK